MIIEPDFTRHFVLDVLHLTLSLFRLRGKTPYCTGYSTVLATLARQDLSPSPSPSPSIKERPGKGRQSPDDSWP